jgi:hypothetical protein
MLMWGLTTLAHFTIEARRPDELLGYGHLIAAPARALADLLYGR